MGWMDVLNRYRDSADAVPPTAADDFDAVAREVPRQDLSEGLEEAFRSERTPPFEQMFRRLFEHSDPDQRAGALNSVLDTLGRRPLTPAQAQEVSPQEAQDVAAQAARQDPTVMQRLSTFYSQHPQLVQALGQAALGIAMNRMAMRRR